MFVSLSCKRCVSMWALWENFTCAWLTKWRRPVRMLPGACLSTRTSLTHTHSSTTSYFLTMDWDLRDFPVAAASGPLPLLRHVLNTAVARTVTFLSRTDIYSCTILYMFPTYSTVDIRHPQTYVRSQYIIFGQSTNYFSTAHVLTASLSMFVNSIPRLS